MLPILGFSSGCIFKLDETICNKNLERMLDVGCNAIELNLYELQAVPKANKLDKSLLQSYEYISIHCPVRTRYVKDKNTFDLLNALRDLAEENNAQTLLFHPDVVEDWSVFENYTDLPLAIENMDNQRSIYIDSHEFDKHIDEQGFGFVADLQHMFTFNNDMTKEMDFLKFHPVTRQVHFSGYHEVEKHVPIHQTLQHDLTTSLKNWKGKPVIIESVVNDFGELKTEFDYIKSYLE